MKMKTLCFTAMLPVFTFLPNSPVFAQNAEIIQAAVVIENNAEQRINLSGKLRMLSEEVALINVAKEEAEAEARSAVKMFEFVRNFVCAL